MGWALGAVAVLAGGYAAKKAYEWYRHYYAPHYEEQASSAWHSVHGYTTDYADPQERPESEYRRFGLERAPAAVRLEPMVRRSSGMFRANEVKVVDMSVAKTRMYTGHQGRQTPQGEHLVAYTSILQGLADFRGTVDDLIATIHRLLSHARNLSTQTDQFGVLASDHTMQTLLNYRTVAMSLDEWQTTVARIVQHYLQAQQYSAHAASGYGSGPQGEGTYKERLRVFELQCQKGTFQAKDRPAAREAINKMFNMHGSIPQERRDLAVHEGLTWMRHSYPALFKTLGL